VDELVTLKDTLKYLSETNEDIYARLLAGIDDDKEIQLFKELIHKVDDLVVEEEKVIKANDLLIQKKKKF
jgi:hypothetical protein